MTPELREKLLAFGTGSSLNWALYVNSGSAPGEAVLPALFPPEGEDLPQAQRAITRLRHSSRDISFLALSFMVFPPDVFHLPQYSMGNGSVPLSFA